MALFSAGNNRLGRTTNLFNLTTNGATGLVFVRRSSDTGDYADWLVFGNSPNYSGISTASNGDTIGWVGDNGELDNGVNLSNGAWAVAAWTQAATSDNIVLYGRLLTTNTIATASTTNGADVGTPAEMGIGSFFGGEPWRGDICAVKIWDRALTAAEIALEMHQLAPVRKTNLHAFYPLIGGGTDMLQDYGPNKYTLTNEGGTVGAGAMPPVSFDASLIIVGRAPVAGNQTVAVGLATETDIGQAVTGVQSTARVDVGQAVETDSGQAVAAIQSQLASVGQAAETDTAQAVAGIQGTATVVVGQAVETDSGQTATPVQSDATVAVGQATEADTAQAVAGVQSTARVAVGQATEADIGQAVTPVQGAATVAVGQATETDTGQAVTGVQGTARVDVGQAVETDSGQAVAPVITSVAIPVGQAIENDVAQPIEISGNILVGQAIEQDSAGGIAAIGQTRIEVHEPWTLVSSLITESASFAITGGWDRPLLIARTSSAGGTLRSVTVLQYGGQEMTLVEEEITTSGRDLQTAVWILDEAGIDAATDDVFTIITDNSEAAQFRLQAAVYAHVNQVEPVLDSFGVSATGGATPTPEALTTGENGLAVIAAGANFGTSDDPDVDVTYSNLDEQIESAGSQSYAGIADAETDGADFTASTTYVDTNVGHMIGLSLAVGIKTLAIGQAESTDSAQSINLQRRLAVGQGAEQDSAQAVTPDTATEVAVGQATEVDSAQAVEPVLPGRVAVGQATEADTAQAVDARPSTTVAVGQATETDTGQALGQTTKIFSVFQATETDTALTIVGQEPPDLDLIRRQKEAGSFGRDRLEQQTEIEHQRQLRAKLIRERDDEDLLSIIPAITRYLLRH